MKPDQERVRSVLIDSIVIMCQKGLNFNCELKLQGVIGITVDYDESFVIHINQTIEAASNGSTSGNPSPSCIVKQEPQQQVSGGYGDSQYLSSGTATPIKRETLQHGGQFMTPRGPKVELGRSMGHSLGVQQQGHFSPTIQSPQRHLQMALVPVNNAQSRMARPPATRGGFPGGAVGPRMVRQQQPAVRSVRPQQVRLSQGMAPSTSFQVANVGQPRGITWPVVPRPKKAPQQRQKAAGLYEEAYDNEFGYDQQQMGFQQQPVKRTRGGGQGRGRGGGGGTGPAKRPKAGVSPFPGHVTQSAGDRSFKLISRYICDIDGCNASFTLKSNLRRHQKSKHPEFNFGDEDDYEEDEGDECY